MGVEFAETNGVGVITLADEPVRNALTQETLSSLLEHLDRPAVSAFVIASGLSLFSAGADVRAFGQADLTARRISPVDAFQRIFESERPVIAALDGGAYGGGAELCLACDAIVASERAFLTFPELRVGVFPTTAAYLLPGLVGRTRALEWLTSQRKIGATEAGEAGLVRHLVGEAARPVEAAVTLAATMTRDVAPSALRALREIVKGAVPWAEVRAAIERVDPAERMEGAAAFKERRPPNFLAVSADQRK